MTQIDHEVLSHKVPKAWRGLFLALRTVKDPLVRADHWLLENLHSKRGESNLSWHALARFLFDQEPLVKNDQLKFVPRLFHLPVYLQRLLLTFIHHHRHNIDGATLSTISRAINSYKDMWTDAWTISLAQMLASDTCAVQPPCLDDDGGLQSKTSVTPGAASCLSSPFVYQFTKESSERFQSLCEGLVKQKPSQNVWRTGFLVPTESHGQKSIEEVSMLEHVSEAQDPQVPKGKKRKADDCFSPDNNRLLCKKKVKVQDSESKEGAPEVEATAVSSEVDRPGSILPMEILTSLSELKEAWQSMTEIDPVESPALSCLGDLSSEQMEQACQFLDLGTLPEVPMATACHHLATMSSIISYTNCVIFAQKCLLPQVVKLDQSASRVLLNALEEFARIYPKQLISGVLIPCVQDKCFGNFQSELVNKIVKEALSLEHRQEFLRQLVEVSLQWHETVIAPVQMLIDSSIPLDDSTIGSLVNRLQLNSQHFSNNLKFGKLVLAVINKYGKQLLADQVGSLNQTLETHKTFLKKSALAALKKIKL